MTGCLGDLYRKADSDIDGFPVGTRASPGGGRVGVQYYAPEMLAQAIK